MSGKSPRQIQDRREGGGAAPGRVVCPRTRPGRAGKAQPFVRGSNGRAHGGTRGRARDCQYGTIRPARPARGTAASDASACSASWMRLASPAAWARASRCLGLGDLLAHLRQQRVGLRRRCGARRSPSRSGPSPRPRAGGGRAPAATSRGTRPASCHWRLDVAQLGLGGPRVGVDVERLGLGEQRLLALQVALLLGVAGREDLAAAGEERVLRGPEPLPELLLGLLGGARRGLPLGHQLLEPVGGGGPLGRLGQRLGLGDQLLLAVWACLRCASRVAKWAPRRRVKPSRAAAYRFHSSPSVFLSTPWIGLPLVEDLLEPVAGGLPAGGLGGDLLGLLDQGGLAGQRLGAGGLAGGPGLAGLLLGDRGELVEPGGEAVEVADDVRLVERAADAAGRWSASAPRRPRRCPAGPRSGRPR